MEQEEEAKDDEEAEAEGAEFHFETLSWMIWHFFHNFWDD